MGKLANIITSKALHKSAGKVVDLRQGWHLMRSPHVSMKWKALSVGIACGAVALLIAVEAPVEIITATLLPLFGMVGDFAFDGFEVALAPVVVAIAILPHLVQKYQPEALDPIQF